MKSVRRDSKCWVRFILPQLPLRLNNRPGNLDPNSELRSLICEGLFTFSRLADPLTSLHSGSSFFATSSPPSFLPESSRMLNAATRPMTTPTVAPARTSTGWWRWSEILEREAKAARRREKSWSQGASSREWLVETRLPTYTNHDKNGSKAGKL